MKHKKWLLNNKVLIVERVIIHKVFSNKNNKINRRNNNNNNNHITNN